MAGKPPILACVPRGKCPFKMPGGTHCLSRWAPENREKFGPRLKPRNMQMIAGAGAGDIEEMPFGLLGGRLRL